jgi:hypothetical protein
LLPIASESPSCEQRRDQAGQEFQHWLALAVAWRHSQIHDRLGRNPGGVWAEKAADARARCKIVAVVVLSHRCIS